MRDLVTGFLRRLSLSECAHRFLAGCDQQMPGRAEPRVLAHAAPLVSGASGRRLRARTRHCTGRDAPAELHSTAGISVYDAERLRLRLGQLSQDAGGCKRVDWLGHLEKEAGGRALGGTPGWDWDRNDA